MRLLLRGRAVAARAALALALVATSVTGFRVPALAVGGVTGTIQGTVTDAATKAPLASVDVVAASPSQTSRAKTDARGFFSFAGLPVDTYTVSFTVGGYQTLTTPGVTVQGDGQVNLDTGLSKALRSIGRTSSRSTTAAYQPKQTTDSYQITGAQQQAALGRQFNISQTQLQSSLPSIVTTAYGSSSIRGSTRTEIAYQFDGIDYTDPLSSQFQNSLGLNGAQSLQVNPGAGDATQGNAGAGAVNIVVKRGSRPSFGTLETEVLGYPFGHQFAGEYGWATPNGRFSNYSSFIGRDQAVQFGPIGTPAYVTGSYLSQDYSTTRDFINNAVYKFGHDNSRSLQLLYQTRYSDFIFNHGGIANLCYKTCDPNIAGTATLQGQLDSTSYFPGLTLAQRFADYSNTIGLLPGQSQVNQKLYYQGFNHQPVDVIKLEFAQQIDAGTYWTNRLYRVIGNSVFNRPYDTQTTSSRVNQAQGGVRTGLAGEFLKQLGDKHQVTLSYSYQGAQPVFDYVTNTTGYRALNPALGNAGGYELVDFLLPTAANGEACPTTDAFGSPLKKNAATGNACGYLAQFFPNGMPRVPNLYNESSGYQHLFGYGVRDVWNVNPKLRLDYGVRFDGSDYQIVNDPGTISREGKHPRVTEPRFAFAYQFGRNDAVRASYGRSVQFTPAGSLNTPLLYPSQFAGIPSRDSRTGLPAMTCVAPKFTSQCRDYAQQIHDEQVAFFGLEAFDVKPATFNNYDLSYSHQFGGNVGLKISPFYKRGYNVNVYTNPIIGQDPVSGAAILGPSTLSNAGIDKTTGVEFQLTKDAPVGLSGFLAMTYVNRLQNTPPGYLGQTEDFYPSIPVASLAVGTLYKAGYLSPLNARLGLAYKTRSGLRVNPIVSYDKGYPIGAGLLTAAFVNNQPVVIPNTNASITGGGVIANAGTPTQVTQYVSPTNPGSLFNPNIVATRGTPEANSAGGVLSRARFNTDLVFEYSKPGTRNTVGLYVGNLFSQIYAEPALSSRYQPVATGIAGPQTGQTSGAVLFGNGLGYYDYGPERFGQNAYNLNASGQQTSFRFYYQLSL